MSNSHEYLMRRVVQDAMQGRVRPKGWDVRRNWKTEPPPLTMFTDRLKREGRYAKYVEEVRARMVETGEMINTARREVAHAWGYDPGTEVKLYRQHMENLHVDSAEMAEMREVAAVEAEKQDEEFEKALVSLPSNAPKQKEIEWIEAHPAMMRSARLAKGVTVLLSADDILKAPHGACPSRSAACQLQHWVNNVSEFYKQIMSEAKKKSGDGSGGGEGLDSSKDESLDELEDMLSNFN